MRRSLRPVPAVVASEIASVAVASRTRHKAFPANWFHSGYLEKNVTLSPTLFFVSGQIDDKDVVRKAQCRLTDLGYRLTHDWTYSEDIRPRILESVDAGDRAARDITGVVEADLYILLSDNDRPGKGMYAELGAALALQQVRGKPRVCIVGRRNHPSVFYLHPAVEYFPTIDCLIDTLEREAGGKEQY